MSVRLVLIFFFLMFALPLQGVADEKLTIYTVNYPLTYFAERIGGDEVEVVFPAPHGEDPAFWSPEAETIRPAATASVPEAVDPPPLNEVSMPINWAWANRVPDRAVNRTNEANTIIKLRELLCMMQTFVRC